MNFLIRFFCSDYIRVFSKTKKIFLEAQITIFASLVIWFTITEYLPLHVKGSIGIFEGPHIFGQFRLVSSVCVSEGCQVILFLYCSLKLVATESNV